MTLFHIDPPNVADAGDELSIQIRLRKALKPCGGKVKLVAVPNGAQRTAWAAIKAKQEGMAAGFPDCIILWAGGMAFVELKTRTGSVDENQHVWLNWLAKAGYNVAVFRSVDTCLAWLKSLGAPIEEALAA